MSARQPAAPPELPPHRRDQLRREPPLGVGFFTDAEVAAMVEEALDKHRALTSAGLGDVVVRMASERWATFATARAAKEKLEGDRAEAARRLAARGVSFPEFPPSDSQSLGGVRFAARQSWDRLLDAGAAEVAAERTLGETRAAAFASIPSPSRRSAFAVINTLKRDLEAEELQAGAATHQREAAERAYQAAVARVSDPAVQDLARQLDDALDASSMVTLDATLEPHLQRIRAAMAEVEAAIASARALGHASVTAAGTAISIAERLGIESPFPDLARIPGDRVDGKLRATVNVPRDLALFFEPMFSGLAFRR